MGMTSLPSADDYVLGLWPGGEEEGDSTEGGSRRKKIFLCTYISSVLLRETFSPLYRALISSVMMAFNSWAAAS